MCLIRDDRFGGSGRVRRLGGGSVSSRGVNGAVLEE